MGVRAVGESMRALREWVVRRFTSGELRMLVRDLDGEAVDLPVGSMTEEFAFAVLEGLGRRGLIDAGFFDALAQRRPALTAEIAALRRSWQVDASSAAGMGVRGKFEEPRGAAAAALRDSTDPAACAPSCEFICLVEPGEPQWTVRAPTPDAPAHYAPDLFADEAFRRDLDILAFSQPIELDHPDSADALTALDLVARRLGTRLTDLLLSADARADLRERIAGVDRATRLTIRIAEGPLADAALALPWELLMPEPGHFAVGEAKLAVVRDAARPGAPALDAATTPLTVAATIAAPEDQPALRYEDEAYRLLKALTTVDAHVAFAELGELDELAELVHRMQATAVHFSGHASPAGLVFEDELGRTEPVAVSALMARLRQHVQGDGTFPRLFFLATRHADGPANIHAAAAALHREGFACVLGYAGPLDDPPCTTADVAFYGSLAAGTPLLFAVQQARAGLDREYVHEGRRLRNPLGWSRLAVYLRGENLPLTITRRRDPQVPPPRLEREEIVVSGLPVLEHGFIGRRGLLHEIRRKLRDHQRLFVLHGLGGLGKTALATHLLRKLLAPDPGDQLILRVQPSTDVSDLRTQAEAHGDTLKLPDWTDRLKELREHHPDPVEGFKNTILALRQHRRDLVIYADNMEALQLGPLDPTDAPLALGTWRPGVDRWWRTMESLAQTGIVLASTRYAWKGIPRDAFIGLDPMSRADLWRMVDTLPTLFRLPAPVRERIAETADGRPRTLILLEALVRQADDDPTRQIADAWTESVEPILKHHGPRLTEDLLLAPLWQHLSPAAVSHATAIALLQQPAPRPVIDALGQATPELIRSGLLTRHRELVDDPTQPDAPPKPRDRWFMLTVVRDFARTHGPPIHSGPSARAAADAYQAFLGESPYVNPSDDVETIRLYHEAGDADAAWPVVRRHALWLRHRGSYLDALQSLADKESDLSDLHRAEYDNIAVQLNILIGLNPDDLDVEEFTATLADATDEIKLNKFHAASNILEHKGKYAEAEAMLLQTLTLIETGFSGVHRIRSATMNNLAKVLMQRGRYPEATAILTKQLEDFNAAPVGNTNPTEHIVVLHNIASAFEFQGLYENAGRAIDASLMFKEALLGRDHPSYGQSLYSRGGILMRQGRAADAAVVFRDAVEIIAGSLGKHHYTYGAALGGLASAIDELGQHEEAEPLMREAVSIQIKSRGEHHPDSLAAIQSLAVMLAEHKKNDEAEKLLRATLAVQDAAVGDGHPSAGLARVNLATLLAQGGNYAEALPLLVAADRILKNTLGEHHPQYASFLHNSAGIVVDIGDPEMGLDMMRAALAIREHALGVDHPHYQNSLRGLFHLLQGCCQRPDAERLIDRFVTAQQADQGDDHVSLWWPLFLLAQYSAFACRYVKARRLIEHSRRIAERNLPPEHEAVQHIRQLQGKVDSVLNSSRRWQSPSGRKRRSKPSRK